MALKQRHRTADMATKDTCTKMAWNCDSERKRNANTMGKYRQRHGILLNYRFWNSDAGHTQPPAPPPPPTPQEDLMWGNLRLFGIWIPLSGFPISGPGGYFQKTGWRCAARFLKPLPYFRPKYVILPTLFQTWPLNQYPRSDQCKKHSRLLFRPNDPNWYSILDQNG